MDYYKILGVNKTATAEEIKKAYRTLAMKHHPDRSKTGADDEQFKIIGEAYAVLSDPIKRQEYDNPSRNMHSKFSSQGFHDMDDFMSQFFHQTNSFDDIFGHQFEKRKSPTIYSVTLSFWEAIFGVDKEFEVLDDNGKRKQMKISLPSALPDQANIAVNVNNQQIIIHVNVSPDVNFTRSGLDLFTEINIPMTKAILGGKITFPHWKHDYEVVIPPGTQHGQKLRLSKAGIKKDNLIGDIYLKCNIIIPKNLTDRQKAIFTEFAQTESVQTTSFENFRTWQKK
jgi:curved DNA-binding protein